MPNIPLWSPRWQTVEIEGETHLQYKPFPRYPTWLTAWVVPAGGGGVTIEELIEILTPIVESITDAATLASAAAAAAAVAQETADLAAAAASQAHDIRFAAFSDEFIWTVGAPAEAISSLNPYNNAQYTSTIAATCHITLALKAGTWTFKFNFLKRNDCGYVDLSLGGVVFENNHQLYSAVTDTSSTDAFTVDVPIDGEYVLQMHTAGKHPSSSGYITLLNKCWGYRTGA